jgi:hypothetical protein
VQQTVQWRSSPNHLCVLVEIVAAILWQKSVHADGFYTGNVRYHRKNPFMMMFLLIEHAGNNLR